MQLQQRSMGGRGAVSPPRRPASAAGLYAAPRAAARIWRPVTAASAAAWAAPASALGDAASAAAIRQQLVEDRGSVAAAASGPAVCTAAVDGSSTLEGPLIGPLQQEEIADASALLAPQLPPAAAVGGAGPSLETAEQQGQQAGSPPEHCGSYSSDFSSGCSGSEGSAEAASSAASDATAGASAESHEAKAASAAVAAEAAQEAALAQLVVEQAAATGTVPCAGPAAELHASAAIASAPAAAATEARSVLGEGAVQEGSAVDSCCSGRQAVPVLALPPAEPAPPVSSCQRPDQQAAALQGCLESGQTVSAERACSMQLPQQPPRSLLPRPPNVTSGSDGSSPSSGAPVALRLGCRAGTANTAAAQTVGSKAASASSASRSASAAAAEPGIAVPVRLLAACGIAAEPPIARATGGGGTAASMGNLETLPVMPALSATQKGQQERRRDTPPQHIAARHQQVEAAARQEVRQALARRGASVARLMQEG